jgi:hypothetical protein
MIYTLNKKTRLYRRLSQPTGYILHTRRLTSRVIPVCMNAELKELQANRRAQIGGAP